MPHKVAPDTARVPIPESDFIPDGRYSWFRLGICVLLGTVGSVGMWSYVVILPLIQAELGISRADASMPYTMIMLGFALGSYIIGRVVDVVGIVRPVIGSAFVLGAGFVLTALSEQYWQLLVLNFVIGLGTATTFAPLIADISHWFARRRGIAVSAAAAGNYLAGVLWPTLIESAASGYGWRSAYIGMGVICIVAMIPLALLLRRRAPVQIRDGGSRVAMELLPNPVSPQLLQILLVIAGIGCCVAMSMPQVHVVSLCADLGFGPARGAQMLSLMLAGGVVSRLMSGFVADMLGGVRTLLIGSVLQCLALALYLPMDGLTSLYIVSLVFGLSQGGIVPAYAVIVREYLPAREAGSRVGLVIMATVIGMALGGWMSGWIYDLTGSYRAAFVNGIAWNLLNISVMLFLLVKRHGRGQTAIVAP